MVPLMEVAINSYVMDWANILCDKLATTILKYRANVYHTTRTITPFYYSAFIMDTICFNSKFPFLRWRWNPQTLNQYISIMSSYGRPITKITCMKSTMILFFLFITLFLISLLLGYPLK